ncbi:type IV pilus biogenesis protein PilM (plasmid) [Cupriavidus pinatubonensis]|uniref:type IV pilus biogenesis protein PilM n=1 Tax=Cupriavidus pinatubonensis TaxID=248026 RepID=UPI001C73555F|nr:type IV pilus biogenesis protein PilM [Cupriavidus pinatubonensis]QYY33593.1 type IV pilus biogenesis protein PilM [Cupriavidus pinatubonensis]
MPIGFAIALALFIWFGYLVSTNASDRSDQTAESDVGSVVTNMQNYRSALVNYVLTQSGGNLVNYANFRAFSGPVQQFMPDATAQSSWFTRRSDVQGYLRNGEVFLYYTPSGVNSELIPGVRAALQTAMSSRGTVGIAQGQQLIVTSSGASAAVTLPAAIPSGASVVYINASTSLPRFIRTQTCQQRYGNSPTGVWKNGPVVQEQFQYEDGTSTNWQDAPAGIGPTYAACVPA